MSDLNILIQGLNDNKVILGILIGIFGYMSIDIKSYIDHYIKPTLEFNELTENAYLNLRFKNTPINEIIKIFDIENPCIPNFFKYAILKQDYLAIESIIVLNYSKTNDDTYMISFNANRFILIALLLFLTSFFIVVFFAVIAIIMVAPLYAFLLSFLSSNISYFLIGLLFLILCITFNGKALDGIMHLFFNRSNNSFLTIENELLYEKTLLKKKIKYKDLCKKGYKLRLDINQEDYTI